MRTLKNLFFVVFFLSVFVSSTYAGGGSCYCNIPPTYVSQGISDQEPLSITTAATVYWVANLMTAFGMGSYAGAEAYISGQFSVWYTDNSGDGFTHSYSGQRSVPASSSITLNCGAYVVGAGGRGGASSYLSATW